MCLTTVFMSLMTILKKSLSLLFSSNVINQNFDFNLTDIQFWNTIFYVCRKGRTECIYKYKINSVNSILDWNNKLGTIFEVKLAFIAIPCFIVFACAVATSVLKFCNWSVPMGSVGILLVLLSKQLISA